MTTLLGPDADVGAVIRQARAAGRAVHVVRAGRDRRTSLAAFASTLDLADWFGHNLDALMDSLRDLNDERGRPVTVIWDHAETLHEHDTRTYRAIAAGLEDVERERDDLETAIVLR